MNNPWQTLNSNIVHQNPYWQARQDRVIRPDGQETDYYLVERGDYVIVIALSEDRKNIFMIRQWRYPLNENSWEIPAGFIDQNETPLQAAQRELKEETGLAAKKWLELGKGHVSPGLTSQSYYIFLAQDLTVGERELEG